VKHLKFWTLGKGLTSKSAVWGKRQDRNVGCIAYHGVRASGGGSDQSLLISGTSQGSLIAWKGNAIVFEKKVHGDKDKGYGIDSIRIAQDRIITGGRDGKVNILSMDVASFSVVFSIDLTNCRSVKAEPRAIDLDPQGHTMIIGTAGNEIYEIGVQLSKQKSQPPVALVQGHFCPKNKDTNEVWGLCAVPGTDKFISVSDDATLRVWSASTKKQLECLDLNRHSSG
jgi:WD40 repeat protein